MAFANVPEPAPAAGDLVVQLAASSVNFGSTFYLEGVLDGAVRGSDGVGRVIAAAEDGTGPRVGERVAFATPYGSWAERCAVPARNAAVIPEAVDDIVAAALPAAALTALQAVRRLGSVLGKRVLVTGATGGVGVFAVQLLATAGAVPVAWTRDPERAARVRALGAKEVMSNVNDLVPNSFDGIIDMVGGELLSATLPSLTNGGTALNVGHAAGERANIDLETLRRLGPGRSVEAFVCTDVGAHSLHGLLDMVARGTLIVPVDSVAEWGEFHSAIDALGRRAVFGKAVLRIDDGLD